MAYDESLAERVRMELGPRTDVHEQKMFGGLAFMVRGHMCVGIVGSDLMLRLGEERAEEHLDGPDVRPMDFTGRPMKGFVFVSPEGTSDDDALARHVASALEYNATLPPK